MQWATGNWQAAAHSSHCTYLQGKKAMDNFVIIISSSLAQSCPPIPTKTRLVDGFWLQKCNVHIHYTPAQMLSLIHLNIFIELINLWT